MRQNPHRPRRPAAVFSRRRRLAAASFALLLAAIDAERADFHAQTPTGPLVPGARPPEPGFPVDPAPERLRRDRLVDPAARRGDPAERGGD